MPRLKERWVAALNHLADLDPQWRDRIDRVGPCTLVPRPRKEYFETLVRAIIGQQISTLAARTIHGRLRLLTTDSITPEAVLDLSIDQLRGVGLSARKVKYVQNLATAVHAGTLPLLKLPRWSDDDVIASLTQVKGIGVWTAEMFLIFCLNRPDVLPVGDLGVRVGIQRHYGLTEPPHPRQCASMAEPWRPFRTVAMWYFWREADQRLIRTDSTPSSTVT